MKKKIVCLFGANSVLANDFIKGYSEIYELVTIQRNKNDIFLNKNVFKNIRYDLSKNYIKSEIDSLSQNFSFGKEKSFFVFILFAWSGKPRDINKNSCIKNREANENIIRNFQEISNIVCPNQIIFISSAGSIYDQRLKIASKESDIAKPESSYGKQKLQAEKSLLTFCKSKKIPITTLRVSSAFGHNPFYPDQGVINKWLFDSRNKKFIKLYNNPQSVINFISFENISKSIDTCIQKKLFGLYNIGSDKSISLKELISIVKQVSDNQKLEIKVEGNELRNFYLDTSLFEKKSGLYFKQDLMNEAKKIYLLI